MTKTKKRISNRIKIVGATVTAIFSLAAAFSGTIAWFSTNTAVSVDGATVSVKTLGGSKIEAIKLIKFDFAKTSYPIGDQIVTIVNYIDPSKGSVNEYDFDFETSTFGYTGYSPCTATLSEDTSPQNEKTYYTRSLNRNNSRIGIGGYLIDYGGYEYTAVADPGENNPSESNYYELEELGSDDAWVSVDSMNIYDPIEKLIRGNDFDLEALKCNAVYEITVSYANLTSDCSLRVDAETFTPDDIEVGDVLLSDCVDFDVFLESQLEQSDETWEDIYDRVTLLSSELTSHPHFYIPEDSEEEKPSNLSLLTNQQASTPIRSNTNEFKIYINVNYCPEVMEQYIDRVQSFGDNIRAVFDFKITIQIDEIPAQQGD